MMEKSHLKNLKRMEKATSEDLALPSFVRREKESGPGLQNMNYFFLDKIIHVLQAWP